MEQTLGKLTFGKLVGYVFPGFVISMAVFLLADSVIVSPPGALTSRVAADFTGIATFVVLLLGSGVMLGVTLDNLHHAFLIPIYKSTKEYKQIATTERPKIDMVRSLVFDNFKKYGSTRIKDKGILAAFEQRAARLKVDDLEWWFILPLSGGQVFSLFLEEYYSFFQFFGSMFFALIGFGIAVYIYIEKVIVAQALPLRAHLSHNDPFTVCVALSILLLSLFCLRRAYRWYLLCYETQVNLIFGIVVDLAFRSNVSIEENLL